MFCFSTETTDAQEISPKLHKSTKTRLENKAKRRYYDTESDTSQETTNTPIIPSKVIVMKSGVNKSNDDSFVSICFFDFFAFFLCFFFICQYCAFAQTNGWVWFIYCIDGFFRMIYFFVTIIKIIPNYKNIKITGNMLNNE